MTTIDAAIIKHITSSGGSGSGFPAEDELEYVEAQYEVIYNKTSPTTGNTEIILTEINKEDVLNGNILVLHNVNTDTVVRFMIIRDGRDSTKNTNSNVSLVNMENGINDSNAKCFTYDYRGNSGDSGLSIENLQGEYSIPEDGSYGLFRMKQMSSQTLTFLVRHLHCPSWY